MTRELALPLAPLFLSIPALAQAPAELAPPIHVPINVTKLAAAEVYGNEDLYGLAIADHRVNLIAAPETFQSVSELGTAATWSVNDLCVLKGRTAGGRDVILSVGPDGLKLTSMQLAQQGLPLGDPEPTRFADVPVTDPVTAPSIVPMAAGAWQGATRVVAEIVTTPDGGFVQIAGLSANGMTLLTGVWSNGIFADGPAQTFNRPVRDLVLLHWQAGDPVFEIGLLTHTNLVQVYDFASLAVLAVSAAGAGAGHLATLHHATPPEDPQPPADVLAWARPVTAAQVTSWDLVLYNVGGNGMAAAGTAVQPIAYPAGGTDFSLLGIVAGDFDNDRIDEVLAVPTFLPDWLVMHQDPIMGTMELPIRQNEEALPQLCLPAIADFDHDGFNDLLVSLEELHCAFLIQAFGGNSPSIFPDDMTLVDVTFPDSYAVMSWNLRNLPLADDYNKIEIAVFTEQYDVWGQPLGADPTPFDVEMHDRGTGNTQEAVSVRFPNASNTLAPLWSMPRINVWGRIRFVYLTSSNAILRASKSYFFGFQPPTSIPDFPGISGWPGTYFDLTNPSTPYPQFLVPDVYQRDSVPIQANLSFGLKWAPSGGRRIFAGVIVPLHGIPPSATGTLPGV